MINTLTKNYYFSSFINRDIKHKKVKAVFYDTFFRSNHEIFSIELDDEDIEYLRKKYILTEVEYKKQELEEALQNVESLRSQIKSIESNH